MGLPSSSSSIGVLGGLGGGGGPGFATFDAARFLFGRLGAGTCANLPASAIGGGALNWYPERGGDGVLWGEVSGDFSCLNEAVLVLSGRLLRDGGGAGAGPLLDETVPPVCCGLIDSSLAEGAAGGGGGGALARRFSLAVSSLRPPMGSPLAFLCSM